MSANASQGAAAFTVHPSAIVDAGAQIGAGSRVWHFVHVCGGARIGERCSLGQNVFVGNRVVIGNNVKIQNNVSVYTGVVLEDDVFCGPSMVFTNVINPRSHVERKSEYKTTLVRRGATLGAAAQRWMNDPSDKRYDDNRQRWYSLGVRTLRSESGVDLWHGGTWSRSQIMNHAFRLNEGVSWFMTATPVVRDNARNDLRRELTAIFRGQGR